MSKVIGITGRIASGKSTATRFFKDLGYTIIDADKIAYELLDVGMIGYERVVSHFGETILNDDKTVSRHALGDMVFSDPTKLKELDSIMLPLITDIIHTEVQAALFHEEHVILDAPLLLNNLALVNLCDAIINITIHKETQINRLLRRNTHLSYDQACDRINSVGQWQYLDSEKVISISNNQSKHELIEKLKVAEHFIWR